MKEHINITILKDACEQFGYTCKQISKGVNEYFDAFVVSKPHSKKSFVASVWQQYPTQSAWHIAIMKYKDMTKHYLDKGGFTTISGKFFSAEEKPIDPSEIDSYVQENFGYPCIIKPNDKSLSKGVELISGKREVVDYLHRNTSLYPNILVQEYIQKDEYRLFIYQGEIRFAYKYQTGLNMKADTIDHFMDSDFPEELKTWAKRLYQYVNAPIIGADVFVANDFSEIQAVELNHNPFLKVVYEKFNKKDLALGIWKDVLEDYFC